MIEKLKRWFREMKSFITHDIWDATPEDLPATRSIMIRQLRIAIIAARGFSKDKIQLRASALTLYSLLSIVPVVAMLFVVANGFGFKDKMRIEIYDILEGHEEIAVNVMDFADTLLSNVNGGFLTGVGIIVLLWSIMKIFGNIESAFNWIWQIKKQRPFFRKFADYLSMMLIAPVFLVLSSSSNVFVASLLDNLSEGYPILENLKFLLKFTPYFLMWTSLTLLYIIMPNTRVHFKSALIAGVVAGTVFQLAQFGYFNLQVGLNNYNAIYGSFAVLPFFLIWLQLSWVIVLLGAEISFANQNVDQYEYEIDSSMITSRLKKLMTLMLATRVVKGFASGMKPSTASELSKELHIPVRLVREITYELSDAGIISELTSGDPKERAYQPAYDINKISLAEILDRLENMGSDHIAPAETEEFNSLKEKLDEFSGIISGSASNVLLKDI